MCVVPSVQIARCARVLAHGIGVRVVCVCVCIGVLVGAWEDWCAPSCVVMRDISSLPFVPSSPSAGTGGGAGGVACQSRSTLTATRTGGQSGCVGEARGRERGREEKDGDRVDILTPLMLTCVGSQHRAFSYHHTLLQVTARPLDPRVCLACAVCACVCGRGEYVVSRSVAA